MTPDNTIADGTLNTDLELAIHDVIERNTPLRIWKYGIAVQAHGSQVVLSGAVRGRAEKETAEKLVRSVKGVTQVENQILVDGDVEINVALALASDPKTAAGFPGILVGVVFGVAYLKGTVSSAQIKAAAGEIAAHVPGVQRVSNELHVPALQKAAA